MIFNTKQDFLSFIKKMKENNYLKEIGFGSQGICYHDLTNNNVYKIFHQFYEEEDKINYSKEELLRFSNIKNKTFIWAKDVIIVNNEIVGYISNYVNAKSLYKINPLLINLNKFSNSISKAKKDIEIISNNGIKTFDVMYNILYGKNGFSIIDYDEYCYSNFDSKKLYNINCDNFNLEIMYFLIDNYFDEFISNYKDLKEMYKKSGVDINCFIDLFIKYLKEETGKEIVRLNDAKQCLNKKKKVKYQRNFY